MKFKIIFIITICFFMMNIVFGKEKNINLDEAIRLRVVANSDSKYDQQIKMKVKENVQNELSNILKDAKNINQTRERIIKNYNKIDSIVKNTLENENYNHGYKLNYGYNYFPQKEYNGTIYNEGEYESLLITLGKGEGENWWCILFPPLCLIEAEETEKVEYESFFIKLINKIF